ncbi:hypothetical protein DFH27DRAFT_562548 [Peziza echinospora]|nr:hypothetical protein DFH27DRAFT_562548 [Peziza echinospora]
MALRHPQLSAHTNVKSLIRRFESLSSYRSVPSLTVSTATEPAAAGPTARVHRRASSAIMAAQHLPSSPSLFPASSTFPPRLRTSQSPRDIVVSKATAAKSSLEFEDNASQQCSGPRLALRRISQSVKRKASFFIEHSQKAEDLPTRKSPPPKRLFGENLGRKVSKKVMEKFDVQRIGRQRNRLPSSGLKDFKFEEEEWDSTPEVEGTHKRSSGDGAGDIGTTTETVHPSTSEDMSRGSQERSSFATDESSTWSSTSYPLRAPATPPVMKRVPKQFVQNLRHGGPSGAGTTSASIAQDLPVYQAGPQRTPEVRNVPARLRRGESNAAQILPGSECTTISSRSSSSSRRSTHDSDRRKRWPRWKKPASQPRKIENTHAVLPPPQPTSAKKITPPKISVRSLIAKFKGVELAAEPSPSIQRQPRNRVELQFEEPSATNDMGDGRRSLSIRTYSTDPRRARTSAFTFVTPADPDGAQYSGHSTNNADNARSHRKTQLPARKSIRSFMLEISAENNGGSSREDLGQYGETDGEHHTLIDGPLSHKDEELGAVPRLGSRSSSSLYTGTPPSLTTADTINSRKRSSQLRRVYRGDISGEDSGFSIIGDSEIRLGTGLSGFLTAEDSEIYTLSSQATPDDTRKAGSSRMSGTLMQSTLKKPAYDYQAYKPPEPAAVYTPHALRPLSDLRKSAAYKGTPAPASFLRKSRGTSSRHEDSSAGDRSGETSSINDIGGKSRSSMTRLSLSARGGAREHLDGGYQSSPYLGYEGDIEDGNNGKSSGGFTDLGEVETKVRSFRDKDLSYHGVTPREPRERHVGMEERHNIVRKPDVPAPSRVLPPHPHVLLPAQPPPPPPPPHQHQYHHYRQSAAPPPWQVPVLIATSTSANIPATGAKHEQRPIHQSGRWNTHYYPQSGAPPPAPPPHVPPIRPNSNNGSALRDLDAQRLMRRLLYHGTGGPTAHTTQRLMEKVEFPLMAVVSDKPIVVPKPRNMVQKRQIENFVRMFG